MRFPTNPFARYYGSPSLLESFRNGDPRVGLRWLAGHLAPTLGPRVVRKMDLLELRWPRERLGRFPRSADRGLIETGSQDKNAKVWDALTGRELVSFRDVEPGSAASRYRKLRSNRRSLDVAAARILRALPGHQGSILCVSWSPDRRRLATGSGDKTAKIWEATTGQELLTLSGHQGKVSSVAWSPGGQRLVRRQ